MSRSLARAAAHLVAPAARAELPREFEAPVDGVHGALYEGGRLVGWIEGVRRL